MTDIDKSLCKMGACSCTKISSLYPFIAISFNLELLALSFRHWESRLWQASILYRLTAIIEATRDYFVSGRGKPAFRTAFSAALWTSRYVSVTWGGSAVVDNTRPVQRGRDGQLASRIARTRSAAAVIGQCRRPSVPSSLDFAPPTRKSTALVSLQFIKR